MYSSSSKVPGTCEAGQSGEGKMTLGFLEDDRSEVENPLETPGDPNHIVEEVLENVHPL